MPTPSPPPTPALTLDEIIAAYACPAAPSLPPSPTLDDIAAFSGGRRPAPPAAGSEPAAPRKAVPRNVARRSVEAIPLGWPMLLTEPMVARFLGISRERLRRLVRDGKLPRPRDTFGTPLYHRVEVEQSLARHWCLSNDPGRDDDERLRNHAMEMARAFRPPAPRVGRKGQG